MQLLTVPDALDRRQNFPLTSLLPVCTFDVSISFKVNCKSEFPDFLIFGVYLVYHYRLLKLLQLLKCAFRLHFVLAFICKHVAYYGASLWYYKVQLLANTVSFYL